jgi:hypothetical protein
LGLDWSLLVKKPIMDMYARPIAVNGVANRGIWHEDDNDFLAEDNSVVTDHRVSIDILDAEFAVVPKQGDLIDIPADGAVPPPDGTPFTVMAAHRDGGGMTNLLLQQWQTVTVGPGEGEPFTGDLSQLRPIKRERGRYEYG